MIASTSVEVTTDNVVIGLPRRAFRGLADSGIFAFRLTQEIPAGGAAGDYAPLPGGMKGFRKADRFFCRKRLISRFYFAQAALYCGKEAW